MHMKFLDCVRYVMMKMINMLEIFNISSIVYVWKFYPIIILVRLILVQKCNTCFHY